MPPLRDTRTLISFGKAAGLIHQTIRSSPNESPQVGILVLYYSFAYAEHMRIRARNSSADGGDLDVVATSRQHPWRGNAEKKNHGGVTNPSAPRFVDGVAVTTVCRHYVKIGPRPMHSHPCLWPQPVMHVPHPRLATYAIANPPKARGQIVQTIIPSCLATLCSGDALPQKLE